MPTATSTNQPDVVLIGAGVMSATLAVFLKELDPNFTPPETEGEPGEPTSKKDVKTPALRAFGRCTAIPAFDGNLF